MKWYTWAAILVGGGAVAYGGYRFIVSKVASMTAAGMQSTPGVSGNTAAPNANGGKVSKQAIKDPLKINLASKMVQTLKKTIVANQTTSAPRKLARGINGGLTS